MPTIFERIVAGEIACARPRKNPSLETLRELASRISL